MTVAAPTTDDAAAAQTSGVSPKIVRSIAAQEFFRPEDLTVAGDASTPHGEKFAGTMLDDGRQALAWSDRHEQIMIGIATSAEFVKNPYAADDDTAPKKAGVPTGDPQLVYVQSVEGATPPALPYAIVVDNGRQRRSIALRFAQRLQWIAEEFASQVSTEKPAQQRIKVRNLCLEYAKDHPDSDEAKFLTRTFVNAVLGAGADDGFSDGGWFDKSWRPIPLLLRIQISGVDADVMNPAIMVQSVARKEAQIETPPSLRARQIQRALDVKDPASGEPKLNPKAVAQLLSMGDDTLNNSLLILKAIPAVQAAIDSGRLSAKVALIGNPGKRDAAFVVWPKGQPRSVVSEAAQQWILKGLLDAFPGDEQIRGAKAFKVGLRLRAEALKGNMTAEAAQSATASDELTVADADRLAATGEALAQVFGDDAPAQAQAPAKGKKRSAIDRDVLFRITEHAGRAAAALPDPTENGLSTSTILDRQRDVVSVAAAMALSKYLAGEGAALDAFPALKQVMIAVGAEATPTGPTLSADEVIQELCAAAIDTWEETPDQFRKLAELKVAEGAQVAGRSATDEERAAATQRLADLVTSYEAAVAAGSLDEAAQREAGIYLREQLYAAPAA